MEFNGDTPNGYSLIVSVGPGDASHHSDFSRISLFEAADPMEYPGHGAS
jgi:hypothetical protein